MKNTAAIYLKLHIATVMCFPSFGTPFIKFFSLELFWPLKLFLKLLNRILEKAVGFAVEKGEENHILHISWVALCLPLL